MILLKLALRNVFRHSTRSLITLSAIAFGCVSIILVDGFFNDLFGKMRESYTRQRTGHIQIYRKGYIEKGLAQPFDFLIDRPDEVAAILSDMPEVEYITPRLEFAGLLSTGETTTSSFGVSMEPKREVLWRETTNERKDKESSRNFQLSVGSLVSGEPLGEDDQFGVLLGVGLAGSLGIKPGDGLVLVANTAGGSMNAIDVNVRGTFRTTTKEYDDRVLRLPLSAAKILLHTESVQSIIVLLKNIDDTDRVMERLQSVFHEKNLDLEMKSWRELNGYYFQTRQLFGRFFLILIIVIVIVVILSIFNTMNMAVLERTSEIGTIRALGHRRREIVHIFLLEGFMIGVLGGLVGALAGAGITELVALIGISMPPPPGATMTWLSEPQLSAGAIKTAVIISIATSVISSIYPARKASRLEIAEALRHVS